MKPERPTRFLPFSKLQTPCVLPLSHLAFNALFENKNKKVKIKPMTLFCPQLLIVCFYAQK